MAQPEEQIATLLQAISELHTALAAHMTTHNTGGSIIDRVAPEPLARARQHIDEADEQAPC